LVVFLLSPSLSLSLSLSIYLYIYIYIYNKDEKCCKIIMIILIRGGRVSKYLRTLAHSAMSF
jgi:hypothetical protein